MNSHSPSVTLQVASLATIPSTVATNYFSKIRVYFPIMCISILGVDSLVLWGSFEKG